MSPARLRGLVWGVLLALAAGHVAWWGLLSQLSNDTEYLESTLAMVAAGPLVDGVGSLYGPFKGSNHRVLVHAPLYYRLTSSVAWPLVNPAVRAWPPLPACFVAGRTLSLAAFLSALASLYRLATLDGAPRRAGGWSVLLTVGSWVIGSFPITVRPDLLGVSFQTAGAFGVLRALYGPSSARPLQGLTLASIWLALAFCVKQHDVGVAVVSAGLVAAAGWRRRAAWSWWASAAGSGLLGVVIAVAYYGAEEVLTAGAMSRCVFGTAGEFRSLTFVGLPNIVALGYNVAYESFPLLFLALAARIARPRLRDATDPRDRPGSVDSALGLYLAAECVLCAWLFAGSEGAGINYALQAVVFASALVGRALSRATTTATPAPGRRAWILAAVAVGTLGWETLWLYASASSRIAEEMMIYVVTTDARIAPRRKREVYFAGQPGYNRQFGRLDLMHDEWLYGLFERTRAAEPRSTWLRPALARSVRIVVVPIDPPIAFPTDPPVVPGVAEPLPELGYDLIFTFGRYRIWERRRDPVAGR